MPLAFNKIGLIRKHEAAIDLLATQPKWLARLQSKLIEKPGQKTLERVTARLWLQLRQLLEFSKKLGKGGAIECGCRRMASCRLTIASRDLV